MNQDGKNPHPLTEGDFNNIDPTWAPNGQAIAFVSDRNGFNQLFVMSADGSNPFAVTTDAPYPNGRNSWSPDLSTLAFYSGTAAKLDRNIYLVSPSGHNLRQITQSAAITWRPAFRRMAIGLFSLLIGIRSTRSTSCTRMVPKRSA